MMSMEATEELPNNLMPIVGDNTLIWFVKGWQRHYNSTWRLADLRAYRELSRVAEHSNIGALYILYDLGIKPYQLITAEDILEKYPREEGVDRRVGQITSHNWYESLVYDNEEESKELREKLYEGIFAR